MTAIEQFIYALNNDEHYDDHLFNEVYFSIKMKLINHFIRNKISKQDSEDFIHDIFIRLIESKDLRGTKEGHFVLYFKNWIKDKKKKRIKIMYKERLKKGSEEKDIATAIIKDVGSFTQSQSADTIVAELYLNENLHDCANRLKDGKTMEKTIIKLFLDGKDTKDIANELKTPYHTIYSRFEQAKKKLKECLENKGINKDTALYKK